MPQNLVLLDGRIGTDPDLRFSESGKAWCSFRLVYTPTRKDGDKWVDEPGEWWDCVCFGHLAEKVAEFGKAFPISIQGRIRVDKYQDRETGANRYRHKIVVSSANPITQAMPILATDSTTGNNMRSVTLGFRFSDRDKGSAPRKHRSEPDDAVIFEDGQDEERPF